MIDEPAGGIFYGGQVAAPVFSSVMGQTLRLMEVPYDAPLPNQPATGDTVVAIGREGN
jgi:cell division protein FtsI (penicillin-binding protein 3)